MWNKLASGVLARHGRLTGSAAFTSVTRVTPRVVNLRGSPYPRVRFASSFAAALLDGHFSHPAVKVDARRHVDSVQTHQAIFGRLSREYRI